MLTLITTLQPIAPTTSNLFLAQTEDSFLPSLLPLALIFLIFYFLLIRPQSKRQKKLEKKRQELKKGDVFITAGGVYAKATSFKNDRLIVTAEISPNVYVEIAISSIIDVIDKEDKETPPSKSPKKDSQKAPNPKPLKKKSPKKP